MPMFQIGAAGIGALAGAYGAKSQNKANAKAAEAAKAPWAKQQPYILKGYQGAEDAYNKAMGMGSFDGDYTASANPFQTQGYNMVGDFAQNQGAQGAQTVLGAGNANIGAATAFGGNAQDVFNRAGQDPTQQIMANAGQFGQNPYLDGQIDAVGRDISRNLNENQMTGLDLAATGGGNMNSSRTGVAQGIMQRGAADRLGDISAQMRGDAFGQGLGMAQAQYNTGMGQQLGANTQLLQAGQFGADQIGNGINLGYGAGDVMSRAGAGLQGLEQAQIDGQRQQFNDQKNNGLDLTGRYMGLVSGGVQGGPVAQSTSPFNSAVAGGMAGMSLYGKWNAGQPAAAATPNAQNVAPGSWSPPPRFGS